ncbi:MAG: DMT family transporter [Ilumatobacteraceae bacterium]
MSSPVAPTSPRVAWLLLGANIAIGCTAFTLVKVALDELGPLSLATGRVVASAALFVLIVLRRPRLRTPIAPRDRLRVLFVGLAGSAGFHVLFNLGQIRVSVAMAAVVMATMPVLTAVGEVLFLRHRLGAAQVVGLLLSTGGCIGIGLSSRGSGTSSVAGLALVALATVLWAAVTVTTRAIGDRYDSWWLYTPGTVLGAVVMLAVDAPHLDEFAHLSAKGWVVVVWLGTASSAFIYYSLARVMTVISGTTATAISTVVTPGSALVAWLVLGDRPTLAEAIGGAVVITGVIVVTRTAAVARAD